MQSQIQPNIPTSGQLDPRFKPANPKQKKSIPFVINGCVVSVTSTAKNTTEPLNTVKEILLSAYRSRIASS